MDPSESSSAEEQLHDLLRDKNLRNMYLKCLKACREFHHSEAKAWFINKLIENKILPPFYKIKKTSIDLESAESASLTSMRRDLEIAKTQAMVNGDTMHTHYANLAMLIPVHLRATLLNKIKERGLGFQAKFKAEKLKRYEHLSAPPKPAKENSQSSIQVFHR